MKNLKIKFGFFSLLAILAVSVFLTACEQGEVAEILEEQHFEIVESNIFVMPAEFEDLTEEQQIDFFENLSEEELTDLATQGVSNEIEKRSCGSWHVAYTYCSSHVGYRNYVLRRWCGPPSWGNYEYTIYSNYGQGC